MLTTPDTFRVPGTNDVFTHDELLRLDRKEYLRASLRQQATNSLYFFAKGVLGFNKLTPTLHKSLCEFLENPHQRKLVVLPRGHYKTTIISISYVMWLSIRDPNIRILIASCTSTNAQKIISLVRAKWERCETLRWLFPEIVPDVQKLRWTDSAATITRPQDWPESTYEAIGAGGTAVSRHFDIIIEDDLVSDDHLLSREQMQKVIEWHQYKESLFVSPAKGVNIVVGTRWAFYDLISWVLENEPDRVRYVRSALEQGVPIFPEEYTIQELERLLSVMGPYKYSCQYLNDPVSESSRKFQEEWIKYYETLPEGTYNYFIACDPATGVVHSGGGDAKQSDFTALVGIAVNTEGDIYITDVVCERLGADEFIYELFHMYESYSLRGSVRVGIETNAFQRALLFPIRQEMKRSGTHFTVVELKASRAATKQLRIEALQPYFANGTIRMKRDQKELLHELRLFPLAKHDDAMDALAYVVQIAHPAHKVAPKQGLAVHPCSFDGILASLPNRRALRPNPFMYSRSDKPRIDNTLPAEYRWVQ